ncbi:MAG: TIGR04552 family protein [Candidatus Eremiobacterota bacterium]
MSGVGGLARYDFAWEILRVFIEGDSPIDLPALALTDRREARDFMVQYGYDLDDEEDRDEAHRVHLEAVAFIKRYFCSGDHMLLSVPAEVERPQDLADLLVWASSPERDHLQMWACATLRVMHTISHLNHTIRSEFYSEVKRQILDRFRHHVRRDPDGRLWLGQGLDDMPVPLEAIYFKEDKSRDSLILKLLHKPNNVAQDVFDRIGVKLVVPSEMDALLTVKYMRRHNLIIFAHVTPGRSRNNLIDLAAFRRLFEQEGSPGQEPEDFVREHPEMPPVNPHSSPEYRSIRFTCRHMVKVLNPTYRMAQKFRSYLNRFHTGPELEALLEEMEGGAENRELRFLFPFEIQIIDSENYRRSLEGASSHEEYKARQLRAARRRIMGPLLRAARNGPTSCA